MNKNQNGFSFLESLLIIVILCLVGITGWYVWSKNQPEESTKTNSPETSDVTQDFNTKSGEYEVPEGFVPYENKDIGFKFYHPEDWSVKQTAKDCPFDNPLYGSTNCPTLITLSSKEFIADNRVVKDDGLVQIVVYVGDKLVDTITAYNYEKAQYENQKAVTSGFNQTPINNLQAFYVPAVTESWKDNIWAIKFDNFYVRYFNRESNKIYNGSDGSVTDTIDYSSSTPTVKKIVESTSRL